MYSRVIDGPLAVVFSFGLLLILLAESTIGGSYPKACAAAVMATLFGLSITRLIRD